MAGKAPKAPEPSRAAGAFRERVRAVVAAIPRGQTLGYAQVALLAGAPGAARAVVAALQALDGVPWWRVLRSDGTVAPAMASEQLPRLAAEGVRIKGRAVGETHRGLRKPPRAR
jgi:methylated-DNA-protein-cysteine methyltransferase-like protein